MNCRTYKSLTCSKSGVGYLSSPVSCSGCVINVMSGHGTNFPSLTENEYFYATLYSPCDKHCARVVVTAVSGDKLMIEVLDNLTDMCFPENSKLVYDSNSVDAIKAIASEVPINVTAPLKYDACTRTLSIDCAELKRIIGTGCGGCGCGE